MRRRVERTYGVWWHVRGMTTDVLCVLIIMMAQVCIFVGTQYERLIFRPIMGRGFRLRGEQ